MSKYNCTYDSEKLKNTPMGMFHCPQCGMMLLADLEHPKFIYYLIEEDFGCMENFYGIEKKSGWVVCTPDYSLHGTFPTQEEAETYYSSTYLL